MATHSFRVVLDDLDWLWNEWWVGDTEGLTPGHLRRGSASLRLLLIERALGRAWRHYGFTKEPTLEGPDLVGLANDRGYRLDLAAGVIAGGGRQNGLDLAFVGAFRVDNPSTGVRADASEGFAVEVVSVAKQAGDAPSADALHALVHRTWYVSEYLASPSAVRRGQVITRRDVIEYFRNYAGGAHLDLIGSAHNKHRAQHELAAELGRHVRADVRDGLHFELLSIGQAVARSRDARMLAERIRSDGLSA